MTEDSMSKACPKCGKQISGVAKFCKYCSAAMDGGGSALANGASRHCEQCGTQITANAEFCKRCGAAVAQRVQGAAPDMPAKPRDLPPRELAPKARPIDWESDRGAERPELPPRDLQRPVRKRRESSVAALTYGSKVGVVGALVALAGCFLPLEASSGMQATIVPSMTKEIGSALIVPLSAIALAVMAWNAASTRNEKTRVTLGGAIIALGSPWAVSSILIILAASNLLSSFGWLARDTGIGIGVIALAIGFVGAVVGGFIILRETVAD
jgi:hypothetical protein